MDTISKTMSTFLSCLLKGKWFILNIVFYTMVTVVMSLFEEQNTSMGLPFLGPYHDIKICF